MPIRICCPRCQSKWSVADDKAGEKLPCPKCGQRLQVPEDVRNLVPITSAAPPTGARTGADEKFCMACGSSIRAKAVMCPKCGASQPLQGNAHFDNPMVIDGRLGIGPILDAVNDGFLDVCQPTALPRHRPSSCPGCGSSAEPGRKTEMAMLGWVVFIVLLLILFWPLCWLGFFVKETWEVCRECGWRLRKVDGPTLMNPGAALPIATGCLILFLVLVAVVVGLLARESKSFLVDVTTEFLMRLWKETKNP